MSGNSGGGGCLLWFISFIQMKLRNRKIKKYNQQARGVNIQNDGIAATSLFPSSNYQENVIISGGGKNERLYLCETLIHNIHKSNHPMIILHAANGMLENIVAGQGLGLVVSDRNKMFDAFTSFEFNEIWQAVSETCKSKYDIKPAGRYILQVAYDLLVNRGKRPYFSGFANCPYFKLSDQIDSRQMGGAITQDDADKLNSLLMTGQTELPKIDAFFNDMKTQIDYLSAPDPQAVNATSVLSAIKSNRILCIDIKSSSNQMLLEVIVNSLIVAMNRGYNFSLMIDDIAFVNNEMLKNTICQKSGHNTILVSKDLYALTGGKEDVFATVIAEAEKTVLFSHSSNLSCDKWSKYVGEYDKIDVSHNNTGGWSQSSQWGYASFGGQSEQLKREQKIKPEQINGLSQGEVIIYDNTTNSLIHTVIT